MISGDRGGFGTRINQAIDLISVSNRFHSCHHNRVQKTSRNFIKTQSNCKLLDTIVNPIVSVIHYNH